MSMSQHRPDAVFTRSAEHFCFDVGKSAIEWWFLQQRKIRGWFTKSLSFKIERKIQASNGKNWTKKINPWNAASSERGKSLRGVLTVFSCCLPAWPWKRNGGIFRPGQKKILNLQLEICGRACALALGLHDRRLDRSHKRCHQNN